MFRDEAVAQIQFILGKRTDMATEIINQLKFAQNEYEHRLTLPTFLKEEVLDMHNGAHVERMPPPALFLREWDEDALWVLDEEPGATEPWIPLEKDSPRYLRETLQFAGQQRPVAYSYDSKDIILFPIPDAVYTFRMIYYAKDTLLDTNIENKWLKHIPYLLIGHAGVIVASAIGHKEAQSVFSAMIAEGQTRLDQYSTSRDDAGKRYVVGGPD